MKFVSLYYFLASTFLLACNGVQGSSHTSDLLCAFKEKYISVSQANYSGPINISHPNAHTISIQLSRLHLAPGESIRVTNSLIDYPNLYKHYDNDEDGFSTSTIPGDWVQVEYKTNATNSTSKSDDFGFTISGYVHEDVRLAKGRDICGKRDIRPAKCFEQDEVLKSLLPGSYQSARAVVRIYIPQTREKCTGWFIGSTSYIITAQHCIKYPEMLKGITIEVDGEADDCHGDCKRPPFCYGKFLQTNNTNTHFVVSDAAIDYTIIYLEDNALNGLNNEAYLQFRDRGPLLNEAVYIPQHAGGKAKAIAAFSDEDENMKPIPGVIRATDRTTLCGGPHQVTYLLDTMAGSSGAPVIGSLDNNVVAIHICHGCDNSGVRPDLILRHLEKNDIRIPNIVADTGSKLDRYYDLIGSLTELTSNMSAYRVDPMSPTEHSGTPAPTASLKSSVSSTKNEVLDMPTKY